MSNKADTTWDNLAEIERFFRSLKRGDVFYCVTDNDDYIFFIFVELVVVTESQVYVREVRVSNGNIYPYRYDTANKVHFKCSIEENESWK